MEVSYNGGSPGSWMVYFMEKSQKPYVSRSKLWAIAGTGGWSSIQFPRDLPSGYLT